MPEDNLQQTPHKTRVAPQLPTAKIVARQDLTEDLWLLWLETQTEFNFKAGQYITIGTGDIERPYSIVSAPHEHLIELFLELVPSPDGNLTPMLHKLQVGDSLTMRPKPKGIFTLDEKYSNHIMVSTVTGVVPFVSMVRSYIHRNGTGHRFYILQGASYLYEFAYKEELESLVADHPNSIYYVPTISRASDEGNSEWKGEKGRVNTLVEKYLEQFGVDKQSTMVYLCGHPGMIEDVKDKLIPLGWAVKEERFWKED